MSGLSSPNNWSSIKIRHRTYYKNKNWNQTIFFELSIDFYFCFIKKSCSESQILKAKKIMKRLLRIVKGWFWKEEVSKTKTEVNEKEEFLSESNYWIGIAEDSGVFCGDTYDDSNEYY